MKKYLLIISILILTTSIASNVFSQNQNVSINNTGITPDASAMLDVSSTDKGILIPRMSSEQRTEISNPAKGLLVFDNTLSQFWFYNGAQWTALTAEATSGGGTLDDAYNFGGSGEGRTITIDNGQVEFQTGTNNVKIGYTGTSSAILEIVSTEKGILIPRMSSAQRNVIPLPETGLLVYDSDLNQFWYFDGTQWTTLSGSSVSGATITDFVWTDATNLLTITEDGTDWDVTIDNEADDLSDNFINDLSNVNAITSGSGQVLKWDGTQWYAGTDEAGAGGTQISAFTWTDASDLLRITEGATNWDVTIDNEADDLSDNVINDLSNVNAIPSASGQVLKWNGSLWAAGTDDAGSGGTITAFSWTDASDLLRITEDGTNWDVTIDNEADDLSDNNINDLLNVNATPSVNDFLQWNGTEWIAGSAAAGSCLTLDDAYNCGGNGLGRVISADYGAVEINITNTTVGNKGLIVNSSTANSFAISGEHTNSGVVLGASSTNSSNTFATVQVTTNATSTNTSGITSVSTGGAAGVTGEIDASATAFSAVTGSNFRADGGTGVYGIGINGVVGETNDAEGAGHWGINHSTVANGAGVYGIGFAGVYGQTQIGAGFGVLGENVTGGTGATGVAGWSDVGVYGQSDLGGGYNIGVYSDGELAASGTKSFIMDHPLDPDNKLLKHFCAESPEVLNIYRGNIILDKNGEAIVELPDYFSAININFSYYLTPIGAAAPELHVKEEVKGNSFVIAGGKSKLKVSWVLYAERNDKYIQAYPKSKVAVSDKPVKGKYISPELYGKSPSDKFITIPGNHKLKVLKGNDDKPKTQQKQNVLK